MLLRTPTANVYLIPPPADHTPHTVLSHHGHTVWACLLMTSESDQYHASYDQSQTKSPKHMWLGNKTRQEDHDQRPPQCFGWREVKRKGSVLTHLPHLLRRRCGCHPTHTSAPPALPDLRPRPPPLRRCSLPCCRQTPAGGRPLLRCCALLAPSGSRPACVPARSCSGRGT